MKKNYMTPELEVSEMRAMAILAASNGSVGGGQLGGQETKTPAGQDITGNAKQMTTVFSLN